MGLFTDLSVGTSGLKTSQYALNVVAHNLANVDTEGYVRQQTLLDSAIYRTIGNNHVSPLQVGLGVDPTEVRQVRDVFLDKAYRQENGRQGYYQAQFDAVTELEDLFGELQGVAFQDTIKDFWVALQELAKEPDSRVAQATLIENGINLVERSDKIFEQMKSYQLDLNTAVVQDVVRINEIGDRIHELNKKIGFYEAGGFEHANDLRDERNMLLDELSAMVKIEYKELDSREVIVSIEGVQFVSEDCCSHMGSISVAQFREEHGIEVQLDEISDALIPIWPHLGDVEVFDWSSIPNTLANSDIGSLKGLMLARGTAVGKYTDIPLEPKPEAFYDEVGNFDEEAYKIAMVQYEKDTAYYNLNVDSSIVMKTQAQFDQLVHGIVTTINDLLCPNKEVTIAAGSTIIKADGTEYTFDEETVIKIFDAENAPVGVDEEATPGVELFSRKTTERYTGKQDIALADGTLLEGVRIYSWEDLDDNYSLYTMGEIEINPDIIENKSKLPIISNNGSGDYDLDMINDLMTAWQSPFATLSPNTLTYNNFTNYYTQFIGDLATRGDEYHILASNQESMVNSVNDQRQGVLSVSSDEELTYLIRYQHAYNASARYINVVDEMLEHLLAKLG